MVARGEPPAAGESSIRPRFGAAANDRTARWPTVISDAVISVTRSTAGSWSSSLTRRATGTAPGPDELK